MSISITTEAMPANPIISGKRFAYNDMTRAQRGKAGAEIYEYRRAVADLTLRQVAAVVGVSPAIINKHRTDRRPRKGFKFAKAIASATAEDVANAHAMLGSDQIFSKLFEQQLPL